MNEVMSLAEIQIYYFVKADTQRNGYIAFLVVAIFGFNI